MPELRTPHDAAAAKKAWLVAYRDAEKGIRKMATSDSYEEHQGRTPASVNRSLERMRHYARYVTEPERSHLEQKEAEFRQWARDAKESGRTNWLDRNAREQERLRVEGARRSTERDRMYYPGRRPPRY